MKGHKGKKSVTAVPNSSLRDGGSIYVGSLVYAPKPNGHYARAEVIGLDPESRLLHVEFLCDDYLLSDVAVPFFSVVPSPPSAAAAEKGEGVKAGSSCSFISRLVNNGGNLRKRLRFKGDRHEDDGQQACSSDGEECDLRRPRAFSKAPTRSSPSVSTEKGKLLQQLLTSLSSYLDDENMDEEGCSMATTTASGGEAKRLLIRLPRHQAASSGCNSNSSNTLGVCELFARVVDSWAAMLVHHQALQSCCCTGSSNGLGKLPVFTVICIFQEWADLVLFSSAVTSIPHVVERNGPCAQTSSFGGGSVSFFDHSTVTIVQDSSGKPQLISRSQHTSSSHNDDDGSPGKSTEIVWVTVLSDDWATSESQFQALIGHLAEERGPRESQMSVSDVVSCLTAIISFPSSSKPMVDEKTNTPTHHPQEAQQVETVVGFKENSLFETFVSMIVAHVLTIAQARRSISSNAAVVVGRVEWMTISALNCNETVETVRIPLSAEQRNHVVKVASSSPAASSLSVSSEKMKRSDVVWAATAAAFVTLSSRRAPLAVLLSSLLDDIKSSALSLLPPAVCVTTAPRVLLIDECGDASAEGLFLSNDLDHLGLHMGRAIDGLKEEEEGAPGGRKGKGNGVGTDCFVLKWMMDGGCLRFPVPTSSTSSSSSSSSSPSTQQQQLLITSERAAFLASCVARADVVMFISMPGSELPNLLFHPRRFVLCPDVVVSSSPNHASGSQQQQEEVCSVSLWDEDLFVLAAKGREGQGRGKHETASLGFDTTAGWLLTSSAAACGSKDATPAVREDISTLSSAADDDLQLRKTGYVCRCLMFMKCAPVVLGRPSST